MSALIGLLLVVLALASTLGAGLDLRSGERADRGVIARVLALNALVIPAGAAAVLGLAALPGASREALWLVAVAPGGASAPLLARAAGAGAATVAWSYAGLALASPGLVWLGLAGGQGLPSRAWAIAAVQIAPLLLGVLAARAVRSRAPGAARALRSVGNGALALVVLLLLVDRGPLLAAFDARTLLAMAALAALTAAAGALAGRPRAALATLSIVRNLTLALLVSEARGAPAVTVVVAAYGLVMYAVAGAAAWAHRKIFDETQPSPP